jgi:hypothetical protein
MDGTALDEEGRIRLAPAMETIWGPEEGIVWALQSAGEESAFVALSGPGRLLRVGANREPEQLFRTLDDGLITTLAADGEGGVIFGLSPEGEVLQIDGRGGKRLLAQTGATFVWALALSEDGSLWIGTGLPGQLQRLRPGGELEMLYETGEDPVRCLAREPGGGLLIGTGGRGKVIRLSAEGDPFVLLDAEEAEIVSLAVGSDGSIYALAADGRKRPSTSKAAGGDRNAIQVPPVEITVRPPNENGEERQSAEAAPSAPKKTAQSRFKSTAGGVLYRLYPDGSTREIWETEREIPFAMVLLEGDDLLLATGDEGRIWMLDGEGGSSKLLRIRSRQASALAHGEEGRLLIGGTTDARVVLLGPGPREEGSYLTTAVDAGGVADWGRLIWDAELPEGTKLDVKVRSGNTSEADESWSDWQAIGNGTGNEGVASGLPPSRWFQARFEFYSGHERSPLLSRIEIFFQPRNRPPHVTTLKVERPGIAWIRGPVQTSARQGPLVADDLIARQVGTALKRNSKSAKPIRRSFEQGVRTFSWSAEDPDGDRLRYALEVRREGSDTWFPLVRNLEDQFYSWDVRAMRDGHYRVRVAADDARDNPDGAHRVDRRVSDAFLIDNSRPTVGEMKVKRSDGRCRVSFVARDPGGSVISAEVALNGGEWRPVYPQDGVADSELEKFEIACDGAGEPTSPPARTVMVRVTDAAGNLGGELWLIPDR